MITFRKIFNSSLFTINVVAIIILLLSAFSDRISPEKASLFPFIGMAFPFILLINALFFMWWLVFLKWKQLLVCFVALICCWSSINAYFPFHTRTENVPDGCIKVLTYNVMGFHHSNPHTRKNPNQVLQYIINSHADIVCLQEHRSYNDNKNLLSPSDLKKALSMYPYSHFMQIETASPTLGIYGMSVYSKYPIVSTKKIPFDSTYNGAFLSEIDIHGKRVTLINCHLETNNLSNEERQQYNELMSDFSSSKIDRVAGSTVKKLKPAFKLRASQAEKVAEVIRENSNPYVIVCGDFNDTPVSYARRTIQGDLKDSYAETGSGPGITYNRNHFYFRIDYILHSKNIRAYNCSVGELKDSDHYPVYTWLEFL